MLLNNLSHAQKVELLIKTNINKDTILSLANKLQDGNMKNETTLREVISELSQMTGKEVSKEKEDKIINAVMNDKVPNDIEKYIDEK